MREWHRLYDETPGASEWNLAAARMSPNKERVRLLEERHEERKWPGASTVRNHFGTWRAAREAAELPPRGRLAGKEQRPVEALTDEQKKDVIASWPGETYDELAERLQVSRGTIWRTLRDARGSDRKSALRSRFERPARAKDEGERMVGLSFSDAQIKEIRGKYPDRTYRQLAKEYDTSYQTIARIIKAPKQSAAVS